jgi:hypothetical protein
MVTMSDFQEFAAFAGERISRGDTSTLSELALAWEEARELQASIDRLRLSEADDEAGRTEELDDAMASIRQQLGWRK